MASPEEDAGDSAGEKHAKDLVEELYKFNQLYFLNNDVDETEVRDTAVKKKMEETLEKLGHKEESLPRPLYQYLCGKALNVTTSYSKAAERMLSQAVKHDPSLVDAWNCLGESYWKQGNVQQAYHCFLGGLSHEKNKVSLRNISMVLRQMGTDAAEKVSKMKESLEKAKEAVSLDVKDGLSWMVLGNAYLSVFFATNQDAKMLQKCANAYEQAEKDSATSCNPDLHFNKSTLLLYEEQYVSALYHLEQACRFDPGWPTPRQKLASLKTFLQTFSRSIANRGKLKPKRLATLKASLGERDKWVGKSMAGCENLSIKILREADGASRQGVLVGGVASCITTEDRVPVGCVLVDTNGDSVGVTIYNVSSSCSFNTGDVLAVSNPTLAHTHLEELGVDFDSIKVTHPQLSLLCDGLPLTKDKLSSSVAQVTAFS